MSFSPSVIEQARREINGAPHGHKTTVANRWALLLDVTVQNIYHMIRPDTGGHERKGEPIKPEYHEWTRIIYTIKKRPPGEAGEIVTRDAVRLAVEAHLIPAEALQVHVSTFDTIARKHLYNKVKPRRNRIQAERPNQMHFFDASTSKFLYIARDLGNDDYLLKLHRPAKHYKNKPIPVNQLRPWIYGVVDDHSGRHHARYTAARGESSIDSMLFLAWAWSFLGLPERLKADQGMLKKSLASTDLVERLGVELPEGMPYAKEAQGKIERPWRTLWKSFELIFFGVDNWEKFAITLSELNQRLQNYADIEYNQKAHRWERDITRMQAWNRINLYGGVVLIPENAISSVARREKRKIGVDGKMEYKGHPYDVKGLHDEWVYVFEGVFEDRLVVQSIQTGKKYEVRDFKPLPLDTYKAHKEMPHQKLVKESAGIVVPASALPYQERKQADEKIVSMPIRVKEERELESPFDVTKYATIEEAWREFMGILGAVILTEEDIAEAKALILECGLDRQTIRDQALELAEFMEEQRAAAGGI